jgi:hypothetical protein
LPHSSGQIHPRCCGPDHHRPWSASSSPTSSSRLAGGGRLSKNGTLHTVALLRKWSHLSLGVQRREYSPPLHLRSEGHALEPDPRTLGCATSIRTCISEIFTYIVPSFSLFLSLSFLPAIPLYFGLSVSLSYTLTLTQTHTCTRAHTHRHTDTQTHRHTDKQTRTDTQTHRHTQTHTDTQTHRHRHRHRHTHTRIQKKKNQLKNRCLGAQSRCGRGWRGNHRGYQEGYFVAAARTPPNL